MASTRRAKKQEDSGSEGWLTTWSDLVSLLLVFFIVMYAMANTDLRKFAQVAQSMQIAFNVFAEVPEVSSSVISNDGGGTSGRPAPVFFQRIQPKERDFMTITAELTAFATAANLSSDIQINNSTEGIIISLSDTLVFEPGSADLRPEALEVLAEVAEILAMTEYKIRIEGNTDNIPTNNPLYPDNWELSVARAVAIVRILVDEHGLDPARLTAAGNAEFNPVVPNSSRENRAMNRRADIVIIYPQETRHISLNPIDFNR